ncbi:hypothetical protein C8F04DRAFT_1176979 [Mycena alexandri]|uniref:Uncharacterized protein n=1 Tax=Mycena alexandri TaxID=1745969 RepID=A0AAD6TBS2_9AGAR|nr:hypothetical protein C8F04DRAFT_1176979 [Mycena alexandri]
MSLFHNMPSPETSDPDSPPWPSSCPAAVSSSSSTAQSNTVLGSLSIPGSGATGFMRDQESVFMGLPLSRLSLPNAFNVSNLQADAKVIMLAFFKEHPEAKEVDFFAYMSALLGIMHKEYKCHQDVKLKSEGSKSGGGKGKRRSRRSSIAQLGSDTGSRVYLLRGSFSTTFGNWCSCDFGFFVSNPCPKHNTNRSSCVCVEGVGWGAVVIGLLVGQNNVVCPCHAQHIIVFVKTPYNDGVSVAMGIIPARSTSGSCCWFGDVWHPHPKLAVTTLGQPDVGFSREPD